ncbi:hypothetical protein, partial [Serratia marcescens]|uniref:hypothetical protein n=1 Tax=Serratia marcescens TaxID=615 RepID=UPI00195432DC
ARWSSLQVKTYQKKYQKRKIKKKLIKNKKLRTKQETNPEHRVIPLRTPSSPRQAGFFMAADQR